MFAARRGEYERVSIVARQVNKCVRGPPRPPIRPLSPLPHLLCATPAVAARQRGSNEETQRDGSLGWARPAWHRDAHTLFANTAYLKSYREIKSNTFQNYTKVSSEKCPMEAVKYFFGVCLAEVRIK